MDDKSKLVEVTIVFCFSCPHLKIISFLLFLYTVAAFERSVSAVTGSEILGYSVMVAHDTLTVVVWVRIPIA